MSFVIIYTNNKSKTKQMKMSYEEALAIMQAHVNNAYVEAHDTFKTMSGDEFPDQFKAREYWTAKLAEGLMEQVNQNLEVSDES